MKQKLINYINAGFPAIAIRTAEETRAAAAVQDVAGELKRNCYYWTAAAGIRQTVAANQSSPFGQLSGGNTVPETAVLGDAARVLTGALSTLYREMRAAGKDRAKAPPAFGVIAFADVHTWIGSLDPITERWMKEALSLAWGTGATIIFIGPDFKLPASWEKFITCTEFELPTREALDAILAKIERDYVAEGAKLAALDNGEREAAIRAASGLTEPEAANAYALAIIEGREEKKLRIETVYREKASAVKRSGLMEIIEPDPRGLDAIGGLDLLKKWIIERKDCYSKRAREYGLPPPKGVLVVGEPGTGKTLGAKCLGAALGVPTLWFDIGRCMGSLVGQSEANTRAVLATAEAVAPCILFIDEINSFGLLAA